MMQVVTVHGILSIKRNWQPYFEQFAEALAKIHETDIDVQSFYYGFTWPWFMKCKWFMEWKIKGLYRLLQDEPKSVIAHSYGTWLLGQVLKRYPELRLNTVILAASILPKDFDWSRAGRVYNFHSTKDEVVELADRLPDFGDSGKDGFDYAANVFNRQMSCGHNDYFPAMFGTWTGLLLNPTE